jgi:hypothetical protein
VVNVSCLFHYVFRQVAYFYAKPIWCKKARRLKRQKSHNKSHHTRKAVKTPTELPTNMTNFYFKIQKHCTRTAALSALCITLIGLPLTSQAYSCKELTADNLRTIKNYETLDGFESINKKLLFYMDIALEELTVSVAEDLFNKLISQGASTRSAYHQSINIVFREVLKVEAKTKEDLSAIFNQVGGINAFVTKICSDRNIDTGVIFRSAWLRTQQAMGK